VAAPLITPVPNSASIESAVSQSTLLKLRDQTAPTTDAHLAYLARYGVRNICGYPEIKGDRLYATVDEL
jgi:mannonate dehydratase